MMPLLVAYATTEGHSAKVAAFIAERLREHGHRVDLVDTGSPAAAQVQPIYQGAILGGSVHFDRHQSSLAHFIRANRAWLGAMPLGFFSVSMAAALAEGRDIDEAEQALERFVEDCGITPVARACVAGALRFTQYDFFKRMIMRLIARQSGESVDISQDREYTDWEALRGFVDAYLLAAAVPGAPPPRAGSGQEA